MHRQLFCNGEVEVRHRADAESRERHVVTFDHFHDRPGFDRVAFGEDFLASRGIAATHIMTRSNDWFQYTDFHEALAAVRATTKRASRILAYGSSMGGYGAIRFADAVGASHVLALSPQYSIDPKIMADENRWAMQSRRTRFLPALNGRITCSADATLLYDSASPDAKHARRVADDIDVRLLGIRYAGHPISSFLSEAGLLPSIVLDSLAGTLDLGVLSQACRAARRISMHYHSALAEAQPAKRGELALRFAQRAVVLQPGSPPGHHFLALRLRALGRTEEAIAVYRECVALDRQPAYLFMYARILLAAGHARPALDIAYELIEGSSPLPDYHYLAFQALLALSRPKAAAKALWSAFRNDPLNRTYWKAMHRLVPASVENVMRPGRRAGSFRN